MDYFEVGTFYQRIQEKQVTTQELLRLRGRFIKELITRIVGILKKTLKLSQKKTMQGAIIGAQAAMTWTVITGGLMRCTPCLLPAPWIPAALALFGCLHGLKLSQKDLQSQLPHIRNAAHAALYPLDFYTTLYHAQRHSTLTRTKHIFHSFQQHPLLSAEASWGRLCQMLKKS